MPVYSVYIFKYILLLNISTENKVLMVSF